MTGERSQLPLSGVRVLDLTRFLAGPFCTMMLADLGAEVIKVEPPGGEPGRSLGPFTEHGTSTYFIRMNRNKKSVALDIRDPAGRELFLGLVEDADVVVENMRPGTLERLEIGWEQMRARNPALIYASLSGFGDSRVRPTPFAGVASYDIVAMALGGVLNLIGEAEGRPIWPAFGLGDIVPGMVTAFGIAAALSEPPERRGRRVDVAMTDVMLTLAENSIGRYLMTGHEYQRGRETIVAPYSTYRAADGYIAVAVVQEREWKDLCTVIERSDLAGRPDLGTALGRVAASDEIRGAIEEWSGRLPKEEASATLLAGGVPAGPVQTPSDIVAADYARDRGMLVELSGTDERLHAVGSPVKLGDVEEPAYRRPPALGEHTEEMLRPAASKLEESLETLQARGVVAGLDAKEAP